VLNAFRHHRGGHQSFQGLRKIIRFVLNAFRHHRGGHPPSTYGSFTSDGCSTPFGITEVGILKAAVAATPVAMCSTPFGITEVGMRAESRVRRLRVGAQRLSASQRWA